MNPEQARKVVQALIELMGAKAANKADPGGAVYAADQVTNPGAVTGFKDTNLRDARQKAREVQGEDPLTPFTAAEHKVETAGMAPSPGKAHLTRTESLGDSSRLPADIDPNLAGYEMVADGLGPTAINPSGRYGPPQSALSKQEMIDSMEAEFADLQQDFQRLAGRPPTPDEMNVGTLESLIDILKEASGEVPTPRASNLNPLDDDIPF